MTRTETATTTAAKKAKKAADLAQTAMACYAAAAELPYDFETNDEKKNARFAFTLEGHHAVRDASEAAAYAAGQAHRSTAGPATIAFAQAAQLAVQEAKAVQTLILDLDREASLAWRREQRAANTDGSFA